MYKTKLWDEDKWNIHSSSYGSSKYGGIISDRSKEDKNYAEQKYGLKDKNVSSDYARKEDQKENESEKTSADTDETSEVKDNQELKEEGIPFRAAKQIFNEKKREAKKAEIKNDEKTIEDAIKKAIEEEKKVIVIDS